MKLQSLILIFLSFSTMANSNVLNDIEGTYKGNVEGKRKDCFLAAKSEGSSWFYLEPYRTSRERKKLDKKGISFGGHNSYMEEKFNDGYGIYLSSIASDVNSMYAWMIGREAKDHNLRVDINNDRVPVSFEFSSERGDKKKVIYNCANLKKL